MRLHLFLRLHNSNNLIVEYTVKGLTPRLSSTASTNYLELFPHASTASHLFSAPQTANSPHRFEICTPTFATTNPQYGTTESKAFHFHSLDSATMAQVNIFVRKNDVSTLVRTMDERTISKCSKTIRELLKGQKGPAKAVTFTGVSPAPLNVVLSLIEKSGSNIYIKIHKEPLDRGVAIYQAAEALQIEPAQPQMHGFIIQFIAHNKLEPSWMVAVHLAFESRSDTSKAWTTMVHQMAWDFNNGKYEAEEAAALQEAARPYPTLLAAVDDRIKDLETRRANFNEASARFGGRPETTRKKLPGNRKINRTVAEHNANRWYEETSGLKEASEDTVAWALRDKPVFYPVTPKKAKKVKGNKGMEDDGKESWGGMDIE